MKTFFLGAAVIGTLVVAASAQTPPRPAPSTPPPARGAAQTPTRGSQPAPATQAPARGAQPAATTPAPARGTQPAATTPAPARGAQPAPATPAPAYTYQAGGRRDPFRSLLIPVRTASASGPAGIAPSKIEGPKDMNVSDIKVKGVLQNGSTYLAMVQGPNGKTYVVHQGDALRNGTIRAITPEGLLIVQDIIDPLSTRRQQEVRKLLRSFEEAK